MAFDLNALAGKKATAVVDYMGMSASIMYDPNLLTAENIQRMQQGDEGFVEAFTSIVKDWDVKRGTKKVPLTKAGLVGVPIPFLRACFQSINRGSDQGEGTPSSDG